MNHDVSDLENLAKQIKTIARNSNSEEDIKVRFIQAISPFLKELGIERPRFEERTIFQGRMDAVYGQCILEFKTPGKLSNKKGIDSTAKQLKGYLDAKAKGATDNYEEALKRISGIATDGFKIFFLRYWPGKLQEARPYDSHLALFETRKEGGFQIIGPMKISSESLDRLFLHLRALKRKTLNAKSLVERFGPGSKIAQIAIRNLYKGLKDAKEPSTRSFYNQWERTFGIVYGEDVGKAERDVPKLAKAYSLESKDIELKPLLFTVHTYFALLIKLLAGELLALQQKGLISPTLLPDLLSANKGERKRQLEDLESGGYFQRYGIRNFLEGDFFRWYIKEWTNEISDTIYAIIENISNFEPATPQLRPEESRDLLKNLYQDLVPKKLRHDLGEYYTPDWVAERVLNQLEYDGNPDNRILDPACGSGTFLTLAIQRARGYIEREFIGRGHLKRKEYAQKILHNIVGYDLNPLAVIAARTNYLLSMGDLLKFALPNVEIPIYMSDSILTPYKQKQMSLREGEGAQPYTFPSVEGDFKIPSSTIEQDVIGDLTVLLEECSEHGYNKEEFWNRVQKELDDRDLKQEREQYCKLYEKMLELEEEEKNGLWARIIKNAFAPIMQSRFDYIAGNPPWVNWENLPKEWRERSKDLWKDYGLFSLSGYEQLLGGAKPDISMLFTYVCADKYLEQNGALGFVITQTLFKTKGAGDGFRRFQLGEKEHLKVEHVDDMVELKPFEGASNRTSIVILTKGEQTQYPTSYTLWQKVRKGRVPEGISLKEVKEHWGKATNFLAKPVNQDVITSPWITGKRKALDALQKVIGKSDYRAREGANTGGLNGAYWI